jgi:hypothetical protein
MKHLLVVAGLFSGLTVFAATEASAVVCARGVVRAGCVSAGGAAVVRRPVVVAPRAVVVRRPVVVAPRAVVVAPRRAVVRRPVYR